MGEFIVGILRGNGGWEECSVVTYFGMLDGRSLASSLILSLMLYRRRRSTKTEQDKKS